MAGPPRGDQAVFSDIDLKIDVFGYDFVNPDPIPNAGLFEAEPQLLIAVRAVVEINGGTAEGRVSALRVFGDGAPLAEQRSAERLQRFSFDYHAPNPSHGRSMDLEFRYEASSFSLSVSPPVVQITSPAAGQTVAADENLILEWTGIAAPPVTAVAAPRAGSCVIFYTRVGDATFVPERDEREADHEPPCPFKMTATWRVEEAPPPASPFRSLLIQRTVGRIQRFIVQ